MSDTNLKFKNIDLYTPQGFLFKSYLSNEYEKILNYYHHDAGFEDYKRFCANLFQPENKFDSRLYMHSLGSGKTITAIMSINNISTYSKNIRILIILPAALTNNWISELKRFLINKSLIERIIFISIDSPNFVNELDITLKKLNENETNILIMDECHLFFSSLVKEDSSRLNSYRQLIDKNKTLKFKIILLSGTPVVNQVEELMYLFNFLRPGVFNDDASKFYNTFIDYTGNNIINNEAYFLKRITGLVSYFDRKQGQGFPRVNEIVESIPMSPLQEESYNIIVQKENSTKGAGSYKQASLAACNFIVPKDYLTVYLNRNKDFDDIKTKDDMTTGFNLKQFIYNSTKEDVDAMSPKIKFIAESIKTTERPCLFYSNYISSTIKPCEYILEKFYDYHLFNDLIDFKLKTNRINKDLIKPFKMIASVYGEIDNEIVKLIIEIFNSKENIDGSIIKLLIVSPKFGIGFTIKHCEKLFIDSHKFNSAKSKQIAGRVARQNTHIDLPDKQQFVDIITLMSVRPANSKLSSITSNEYLKNKTEQKDKQINAFLRLMKIGSVDFQFNKFNPEFNNDEKLIDWMPNIDNFLELKPFLTYNPIDDYDLKINNNNIQTKFISGIKIKVYIESINKSKDVLLLVKNGVYLILDEKYKVLIGKIRLSNENHPLYKDSLFIADLF